MNTKQTLALCGFFGILSLGALAIGCGGDAQTNGNHGSGASGGSGGNGGQGGEGGAANHSPEISSMPPQELRLWEALGGKFAPNQLFISSSRTDEIRVYDGATLSFVESFTHPAFSKIDNDGITYGPNGAAFNARGNLVVAAYEEFVEFSDYGVAYKTYPKAVIEATENVIFDALGNLYTTTSSGGSNKLNQYAAADYAFVKTIELPAGADSLTGITFDSNRRLYVASQAGAVADKKIYVAQADEAFGTFTWGEPIATPSMLTEGMQINPNGELVVAAGDLRRFDVSTGMLLGTFDAPTDVFPVPLRVDNVGNIYTADFEDGAGSKSSDLFRFTPDGSSFITANDPGLLGPFGLAVSGTVLPGDPPVKLVYQVTATDPDGDTLSYSLLEGPNGMTIDPKTGELTWTVTSKNVGSHNVKIQVDDGKGGVVTQSFTLVISGQ